jgi:hypothetical protein
VLLLLLLLLLLLRCGRRPRRASQSIAPSLPPNPPVLSPSWLPLLGSAIDFGKDPLAFLRLQRERHGDIFTAVVGGQRMVFVCDHSTWGAIFRMRDTLSFKPVAHKVVSTAFQVPMSTITPMFASEDGHLLHKMLITHMSGDKLQDLASSASAALEAALGRMEARASPPDIEGFRVANMYSAVARAVFDATLETFLGADFVSDESWLDFTTYDSQFSYLAGGAPGALFPGAIKALDRLCELLALSPSYATADAPVTFLPMIGLFYLYTRSLLTLSIPQASPLMRDRRQIFTKLQQQGGISRAEHLKFQVTVVWAMLANTMPASAQKSAHIRSLLPYSRSLLTLLVYAGGLLDSVPHPQGIHTHAHKRARTHTQSGLCVCACVCVCVCLCAYVCIGPHCQGSSLRRTLCWGHRRREG